MFHAANNPLILGRNITSEVNATIAYLKSFAILTKEIIQIFLICLLLFFANYKITILIVLLSIGIDDNALRAKFIFVRSNKIFLVCE